MNTPKTKIYISGKITGLPLERAAEYFQAIEDELLKLGYEVINPMKIAPYNPEWTWDDYMSVCMAAIPGCKEMFMLSNWENSKGAKVEHEKGLELGLIIHYSLPF